MSPPLRNDSHGGQTGDRSRRTFLLGVGAVAALAGCLDDGGDDTENESTDEEDNGRQTSESDASGATPEPAESDDGTAGGLSRAEARALLPPESLAFRYEPPLDSPFGELWAAVVGQADASAVRAEAESGGYNRVSPQEGTVDRYLGVPVQVDPDGDAVTVFAVNDDGERGPVTEVSVPTAELTADDAEQAVPPEALSFTYEPPDMGEYGSLTIEVTADTGADALVARPKEGPSVFTDRVGDISDDEQVDAGTTLSVAVDPDGDEVTVWATVDGATGVATRWQGPD